MKVLILAQHLAEALGGIEIQCDLIARQLIAFGHQVTYAAVGRLPDRSDLPYDVAAWCPGNEVALTEVIHRADPDIIYLRHNKHALRSVTDVARRMGIPVVFAASSLQDVQPWSYHRGPGRPTLRRLASVAWQRVKSRWNWTGFRNVAGAVSLNPDYTELLPVVRRIQINDSMESTSEAFTWPRPYVAWVAQLKTYKHPEAFVELARRCSDLNVDFLMVGGVAHESFRWIAEHRDTPTGFKYLGPMTPRQVNGFLASSELLVHTCDPEGFGNNFIQAWQQGRPTLSLCFDPGGIIERERLGAVPGSAHGLEIALRRFIADPALRDAAGERAREFARDNYDPAKNVSRLVAFFHQVIGDAP